MRKLFEKFFNRKPAHHDQSSIQVTINALVLNDEAKDDIEPSVILKPIIRPGPPETGWFGGDPMLPADSNWPQIDGISLCFLAQIDLSKLPQPIWSGVGPRDGYLVFFVHPERCEVRALHVKDGLVPRSADVPQPNHCWGGDRKYYPFNKFPVTAMQNVGQMPEPIGCILGRHKNFPHPFGGDKRRLISPTNSISHLTRKAETCSFSLCLT
ncbi:DUF1963 domain-containing protein [Thioclava sp. BHET1]|nr:DUF1963 domain-containing protein [Thioclava sp. BHET1]